MRNEVFRVGTLNMTSSEQLTTVDIVGRVGSSNLWDY